MDARQLARERATSGEFVRQPNRFTDRITADGSSGYPAEPGRYHLYVSLACPWAHRTLISRRLLGLEDAISVSVVDPIRDERGWAFTNNHPDPVEGFAFLADAYRATDPDYDGRVTVPAIWDRKTRRIVTNDFGQITLDFATEWTHLGDGAVDLYPVSQREEIDALAESIYRDVNNGVYRAGFAATQAAYDEAVDAVFARLDELEARLASHRYLMGARITEADVRLYPSLARFDAVYYSHFKCNLRRIVDYPNLWGYVRDLFSVPAFGETTDLDHIKRHYYGTHPQLNPTRIVPKGPAIDFRAPHDRDRLG